MQGLQIENRIKYSALVVFLLTAWFSIGHHHSDEYFQILEFAQYKLGHISASELPWDFHNQIRPSIQPWIAFLLIRSIHFFQINNPFFIAAILRILSALLAWLVISKMNNILCKQYFPDKRWGALFYFVSYLLWFIPYLSVRFSSENFAQLFLLLGLCSLLKETNNKRDLFLMGIFFGLSVLFRYQMGIAIIGIFFWILLKAKIPYSKLILPVLSFCLVIVIGIYLDFLFYNEFTITAFNYLKLNLIDGKASDYGTSPWWYFIVTFLGVAIPPISIILFVAFLSGTYKLKNSVFTWSIIPFLLIHFFIGHKEIRFIFPMSYLFVFISIYGLAQFFKEREVQRWHRRLFRAIAGLNVVLILFMMIRPAHEMVANYKYLYHNIDLGKQTILTIGKDNYKLLAGLQSTFYAPEYYFSDQLESEELLVPYLYENQIDTCFFVYGKFDFMGKVEGYKAEKVYSVYPEWLKKINGIDWQKSLKTHSIYLITRN